MKLALNYILAVLLALTLAPMALAQSSDDGELEIRSAYAFLEGDVYYLNLRGRFPFGSDAREALSNGIDLRFEIEIDIERKRGFLPNDDIANLEQSYLISYNSLTREYRLLNNNSGEASSFDSLDRLRARLESIESLPLLDAALVRKPQQHEMQIRAELRVRSNRRSLNILSRLFKGWRQRSDWYRWPLETRDI